MIRDIFFRVVSGLIILPVFLCVFAASYSCEKAPHLKPGYVSLEECLVKYHDAIRWRDYDIAMQFIVPVERDNFMEYVESVKGRMMVESYEVVKVDLDNEKFEADVVVKRIGSLLPSVTVKEDELEQHWVLVGKAWYLAGPPF